MPTEAAAFIDQLRDQAIKESKEEGNFDGLAMNHVSPFTQLQNQQSSSLNKSLYHLQSLVYNNPNNLLSKISTFNFSIMLILAINLLFTKNQTYKRLISLWTF
jgi:hypothetical protein